MPRKTAAQLAAEAATPVVHASLNEAVLAVQADMPAFQRDSINPHFRSSYLTLETLLPQVVEIVNRHGLTLTQWPTHVVTPTGAVGGLRTRLTHVASGERDEDVMLLAGGENPQKQGSAISYAKRYATMAILGITADKDDDGNAASAPVANPVTTAPATPASAPVSGGELPSAL